MGALDVGGYEYRQGQEAYHAHVDREGVGLVESRVYEEERQPEDACKPYPEELLTRKLLEREYVGDNGFAVSI